MAGEKGSKDASMGKVGQSAHKGEDVARGMAKSGSAGSTNPGGKTAGIPAPGAEAKLAGASGQGMGEVGRAAEKGEDVARGMSRAATSATNTMADAGASAARTMGQAAASAMGGAMGDARMFENLRMPAMPDMDLMLGAYRRNLEALSAANRVALEGAQQVARRNMEIMQQTMSEMTDAMRGLASAESPQDRAGKQAEMLKGAYERAVQHMKELADLIQHSSGEALDVLNQRFAEAVDEARTMVEKARPG